MAVVLAISLALQGIGWAGSARSQAIPPTVGREVRVGMQHLLPGEPSTALAVDARGVLRTAVPSTTPEQSLCSDIWFTAVALVWRQTSGDPLAAVVRVAPDDATFGRPHLLRSEPDEGPDAWMPDYHPARQATDLLWTGGGRCIRFSLRLPAGAAIAHVKAVFVNTSGTAEGPGADHGAIFGPASAEAAPAEPGFVSRAAWGASPSYFNTGTPGCRAPYYAPKIKVAYVHHTSGSNSYSPSHADDVVRGIYWFHTQERGYCDIAYSFLVSRYGQVFVGRAGGIDRPVIPGAQSGFNTYTFAVAVMGNFQGVSPPASAVHALERVLAWRLDVAHVPAIGHATLVSQGGETDKFPIGARITLPTIAGHRQTSYTDCPGGRLYARLPSIRRTVAEMGGPKILRPRESTHEINAGQDAVRFTASATDPFSWSVAIKDRGGQVERRLADRGRELGVTWGGRDAQGVPVAPGKYAAVVTGRTGDGRFARKAELPIEVVAPGAPPETGPLSPAATARHRASVRGFRTLNAVAAASARDVWAVGSAVTRYGGRALILHWNGSRWLGARTPSPGTSASLSGVAAISRGDAWAVGWSCADPACASGGDGSRTLALHWDGTRWRAVPSPNPGTGVNVLRAVAATSSIDVWAVGDSFDEGLFRREPLLLHWDGASWSVVPGPDIGPTDVRLTGISTLSSTDVWVVGHRCVGACAPLIRSRPIALRWNGVRWSVVHAPNVHAWNSSFEAVAAVSGNDVWAVGSIQRKRLSHSQALVEHWTQDGWRRIKTPQPGNQGGLFGAVAPSAKKVWALGDFGFGVATFRTLALRRTPDGWRVVSTPSPSSRVSFLSDAAALSPKNVWAVGPSLAGVLIEHWNGKRWAIVR